MNEVITCDLCGDECPGTWECTNCSATLCRECATEYEGVCGLCVTDEETA